MYNRQLFDKIFQSEDENEVIDILKKEGIWDFSDKNWMLLGGDKGVNNQSTVQGQTGSSTGALVEKLTNSMDALLTLQCKLGGIDPKSKDAPSSIEDATYKFYNIAKGELPQLFKNKKLKPLADNINIFATGALRGKSPCVVIADKGEGQEYSQFSSTLLSINERNKSDIPFVQGKFNAGATATIRFSGEKEMNLIVSRKHPQLVSTKNSKDNEWTFTIIRRWNSEERNDGLAGQRTYYLAPEGDLMTIGEDPISVLPSNDCVPYKRELEYGTAIKLYNYEGFQQTYFHEEVRAEIEHFLPRFPLPGRIIDTRNRGKSAYNNIVGIWNRNQDNYEGDIHKIAMSDKVFGNFEVEYSLHKYGKDSRFSPPGIYVTLGHQVQGELSPVLIQQRLKLSYLKDYLRIQVNADNFNDRAIGKLTHLSRDRIAKNEYRTRLEDLITDKLEHDPWLKEMNAEYRSKDGAEKVKNNKLDETLFKQMIKINPNIKKLLTNGKPVYKKAMPSKNVIPFKGVDWPTFFYFPNKKSKLSREIPSNFKTSRVQLNTDVKNDYFDSVSRNGDPGIITTNPDVLKSYDLRDGNLYLTLEVPSSIKIGEELDIEIIINDTNLQTKGKEPFKNIFRLKKIKEAKKDKSNSEKKVGSEVDSKGSKIVEDYSIPTVRWSSLEELQKKDQLIKPKHSILCIGDDWWGNENNRDIVDMKERSKPGEQDTNMEIIEKGLLYLGLALKNSYEITGDEDIEKVVKDTLATFTPWIVPMVKSLSSIDPKDLLDNLELSKD